MINRVGELARRTWWLLVIVAITAVLFAWLIRPVLGLVVPVVVAPVFLYFAFMRFDDDGEERADRTH